MTFDREFMDNLNHHLRHNCCLKILIFLYLWILSLVLFFNSPASSIKHLFTSKTSGQYQANHIRETGKQNKCVQLVFMLKNLFQKVVASNWDTHKVGAYLGLNGQRPKFVPIGCKVTRPVCSKLLGWIGKTLSM